MPNEIDHGKIAELWLDLAMLYIEGGDLEKAGEARIRAFWHERQLTKKESAR